MTPSSEPRNLKSGSRQTLSRACAWLLVGLASTCVTAEPLSLRGVFETPVEVGTLDPAVFAEWAGGREQAITPTGEKDLAGLPQGLVWTRTTVPSHAVRRFGEDKSPGARHLRVGFTVPLPVGSVLVAGKVAVSALRPEAAYPGDLGDDSQWLPARRIADRQAVALESESPASASLWALPAGTTTRALRFTRTPGPLDASWAGSVGGVYVLAARYANLASLAQPFARSTGQHAGRLVDGEIDFWRAWENIKSRTEDRPATVAADPEWLLLTWPEPVTLRGVGLVFTGFGSAEFQVYAGPVDRPPKDAPESDWRTVRTASEFRNYYPLRLGVSWVDFGETVTSRALRLRLTAASVEGREFGSHLKGRTNQGKRVWLSELLVLSELGERPLEVVIPESPWAVAAPGMIPVTFTLPEEGLATLVIEDSGGRRVRNLVSETPFPKGVNTVDWDGTDDLGRDLDAAAHGLYRIPGRPVTPGEYRVRGLWRKPVRLAYEFSVYVSGDPPWGTEDSTGGWLANHTPPQAAAFAPPERSPTGEPVVFLGCYMTEGTEGLAWVDLDGRKRGGKKWIGGHWTAAPYLAVDLGARADTGVWCYVASAWETGKKSGTNELRVTALTPGGDRPVLRRELPADVQADGGRYRADRIGGRHRADPIGGLAAHDGVLAVSLTAANTVLLVESRDGSVIGEQPVEAPRGLAYDPQGRLLVLAGRRLLRFDAPGKPGAPRVVVDGGLEDPFGLALDADGNLYVSDRGASHQVKVFAPDGRLVRTVGHPGAPQAGRYDPLHMNNPHGLAVDSRGRIWVTENDHLPKRVGVWTPDGALETAFYGPPKYGGGGTVDAQDPTRFYYAAEEHGAMEFRLDWERGAFDLVGVLCRQTPEDLPLPVRAAAPETALYRSVGGRRVRYFTNCYNSNPTKGQNTGFLFVERNGVLQPVAGMGRGQDWRALFTNDALRASVPTGVAFDNRPDRNEFFFIWSDRNGDAHVQSDEVQTIKAVSGGVTVLPDFSFCVARLTESAGTNRTVRFRAEFGAGDAPAYALERAETLLDGPKHPASTGGDQVLADDGGRSVVTLGAGPFAPQSICGGSGGVATWSYPNLWPGLHASHRCDKPSHPGQVIGATRLLGGLFTPSGSDAGPLWAVNGNMGNFYIFTLDGLFVATLFEDTRLAPVWRIPVARRGMSLDGLTLGQENFWPTITATPAGQVYAVDGRRTAIIRVDGLETVRRLPDVPLKVTAEDLHRAQEGRMAVEAVRRSTEGGGVLHVARLAEPPRLDGRVDEWPSVWVEIDRSGAGANFNSDAKPYDLRGAVAVCGDTLFAAWQTAKPKLLQNSGEQPLAPFKTGGCLDLMIATDPAADPARRGPATGDVRLLVTQVGGKTLALLYRPVVPGTTTPKVPFSSPWRTIEFDRVDDVSADVRLAADGQGNYEIAVPLAILKLDPKPGLRIRGDIGVLRGDGSETVARTYWSNKATAIVADVPDEAMLTPALWGAWEFLPEREENLK